VSIVAPFAEQSGAAQSLTLRRPIVVHAKRERHWAVEGTPADAVIVALHKLLPERPDLVISGINHGANMGENVYYSGTVGAAREAALHHIPAVAMSLCARKSEQNFAHAARIARSLAEIILQEGLPDQVLLNVNVPEPCSGGVRFTRQSKKITRNQLSEGKDPRAAIIIGFSNRRSTRTSSRTRIMRRCLRRCEYYPTAFGSDRYSVVDEFWRIGRRSWQRSRKVASRKSQSLTGFFLVRQYESGESSVQSAKKPRLPENKTWIQKPHLGTLRAFSPG